MPRTVNATDASKLRQIPADLPYGTHFFGVLALVSRIPRIEIGDPRNQQSTVMKHFNYRSLISMIRFSELLLFLLLWLPGSQAGAQEM
ncbi:MAG: hypothetical protein O6944_02145, partial [Gammaproteobacteria bacterium]|nr:hypothetical protein [Gammaproteobacteria bacterium]